MASPNLVTHKEVHREYLVFTPFGGCVPVSGQNKLSSLSLAKDESERGTVMSMRKNHKIAFVAASLGVLVSGLAWATPIFNLASPVIAMGMQNANIETHGKYDTGKGEFRASIKTDGPSTFVVQDAAFSPGGYNGWHSHPGLVIVTLVAGSIDWYDADCNKTTYKAGDTWTEGSAVHYFKSTSPVNLHLITTFVIAQGSTPRIDEPAPVCAAGLGLN